MNIAFPLLLTLFFALVHYLSYTRVVKHLHVKERTQTLLRYLLVLNMLGILGYLLSRYAVSPPKELYFMFSLSIGVGFVVLVGTLVYELLRLMQHHTPFQAEKRAFFKRTSDAGFLALGSAYFGSSVYEGAKEPVVQHVNVNQGRFGGKSYTIVQISDLHIGGLIDRAFVAKSVEAINALKPDVVAITGDISDAHVSQIEAALNELGKIKSRLGTYYVVGNHEYFHGIEATMAHLKSLGIEVLENRSVQLESFYIAGVYDLFGYRRQQYEPDIAAAMQEIPHDAPSLLLAHQPKYVEYLEGFTPSLMLSGHTHGGQIWPFHYAVRLVQPYVKGLHTIGENRHIYINSGIGFWGPAMRLGSQAEITCISWS